MSSLTAAAMGGIVAMVKKYLKEGADPDSVPIHTIIHSLCRKGLSNKTNTILNILFDAGANVDAVSGLYDTPLLSYAAISSSDMTLTRLLLEKGADPNKANNEGVTPLMQSFNKSHNLKNIEELLRGGADINAQDKDGKYPIHYAIDSNHAEYVQLLLNNGASKEVLLNGKNVTDYVLSKRGVSADILALFGIEGEAAGAGPASSPGSKLSRTSAKSMARPAQCLDPIMADHVNIGPLYTVFYVRQSEGNVYAYCLDSMTLNAFMRSYDYVFFRCKPETPKTSLLISRAHVEEAPIRRLDLGVRIYVEDKNAQKIKVGRAYILEPTKNPVGRLASHAVLDGGSVVSGMHCQDEEPGFIHNIKEIVSARTRIARSSPGPKTAGGRRRTYRKNRR